MVDLGRWADLLAWDDTLPCSRVWLRHHLILLHAISMQLPLPIWQAFTRATGTVPIAAVTRKGNASILPFVLGWLKSKVTVI